MPDDWTDLLDRHGPALLLYARQLAAGRADAEDAVQEGFVRFWSGRARAADAAGYLFACVRSAALDARRSSGRRLRREQAAARPEGLFDAAAAVLADGPDALAKLPDPFGGGKPFVHRKTDRGFVLESALADRDGKPVQLTVGPAR
jgi:DNA-directed RNA polymerase specialized sigma24 family protein